jgi:hypothetical protein
MKATTSGREIGAPMVRAGDEGDCVNQTLCRRVCLVAILVAVACIVPAHEASNQTSDTDVSMFSQMPYGETPAGRAPFAAPVSLST